MLLAPVKPLGHGRWFVVWAILSEIPHGRGLHFDTDGKDVRSPGVLGGPWKVNILGQHKAVFTFSELRVFDSYWSTNVGSFASVSLHSFVQGQKQEHTGSTCCLEVKRETKNAKCYLLQRLLGGNMFLHTKRSWWLNCCLHTRSGQMYWYIISSEDDILSDVVFITILLLVCI